MTSPCCRLCLANSDDLESILSIKNGNLLLDLIRIICPISIETAEDDLPRSICQECVEIVTSAHQIRVLSVQSDFKLRSMKYRDPLVKSEVIENLPVVESPRKYEENREVDFEDEDWENDGSMQHSDYAVDNFQDNSGKNAPGCHKCNHCDRIFSSRSNVRRHERLIHNVKNITMTLLKCEECSYQTYQQFNLTSHMMRKHSTGGNKCNETNSRLECGYCQKGFLNRSNTLRHVRTVHGSSGRLHPCNLCHKYFLTNSQLIKHVENHHETVKKGDVTEVVESDEKPKSTESTELLCDLCPYQTNCRIALTHHMLSHVEGAKPPTGNISRFQCRFCGRFFTHTSNRNRHEREKHLLKTSRAKISLRN